MALRVAFVGFQTGHAYSLYKDLSDHPDVEVVAACEEDKTVRGKAVERGITITHWSYAEMLRGVECDAVACSDWYGIRGERLIEAMNAGKHVICDKPLCTRLSEIETIKKLAHSKHLKVGCQLPAQYHPPFVTAQHLVRDGAIGEVHTVNFNGAHSLNFADRPSWMFDSERYGGTINDIAIHGIDALPWLTGRSIAGVTAAREWNARVTEHPSFHDGAVVLFKLDNDGAAYGDVSWLSPDKAGYKPPYYWRFLMMGTDGTIGTGWHAENIWLYKPGSAEATSVPLIVELESSYVDDWLLDIANTPAVERLHTDRILKSTRMTLFAQHVADTNGRDVKIL